MASVRAWIVVLLSLYSAAFPAVNHAAEQATLAFIVNAGNNNVEVLDLGSGQSLTKLYTGATPWRLVLSPDKKNLWVQHWYSEKTVVVDMNTQAVQAILPARGPGLFNSAGDRFWTFSWPSGRLVSYDAKTFAAKEQQETQAKHPYSLTLAGQGIYVGQYDPITQVRRPLYDTVLSYTLGKENDEGDAVAAGDSSIGLSLDPTGELLVAANADGDDVRFINIHHAQAKVTLFPGPRKVLFAGDKRMIVLGWKEGAQESDIAVLDVDWKQRPWPEVKPVIARKFSGGLATGQIDPAGKILYALDRVNGRLIAFDINSLEQLREIKVGDTPYDVVITQVPRQQREHWTQKRASIIRLEEILAQVKAQGEAYSDLRFTETLQAKSEKKADSAKSEKDQAKLEEQAPRKKVIHTFFRAPDGLRQEFEPSGVRLAQGGRAYTISAEGRFIDQPRQDLLTALYGLYALPVDEAIRQLAGDVPGSSFLKNGMAVDIVAEVTEDEHKYFVIGAQKTGDEVSQLWIRAEDWTPVDLIEKIPVFETRSPHMEAPLKSVAETKLIYEKVQGKYQVPTKMVRVLDGKETAQVTLSGIQVNSGLQAELFDLQRLGGLDKKPLRKEIAKTEPAKDGPGEVVPGLGNEHIDHPFMGHAAYNSEPPTSGTHVPYKINWGISKTPVPPEVQVRHLEEGGVLVQYNCPEGCAALVQRLEGLAMKYAPVLVAPYPMMSGKIALTAWERLDTLEDFDEKRITGFIEAYLGKPHFPVESNESHSDAAASPDQAANEAPQSQESSSQSEAVP